MQHPGFFESAGPFTLRDIADAVGAEIATPVDAELQIQDVRPLGEAKAGQLTFFDNPKYRDQLGKTAATACLLRPDHADLVAGDTCALTTAAPYHAFAKAMQLFYPDAMRSTATGLVARTAATGSSTIHPSAQIAADAVIETGAFVGEGARIESGVLIASGAVIGYRVHIGAGSYVGPGAAVMHAIVGKNVVVHAGVRIGQDGFGFAMGPQGHIKVPQIGRVIIEDDVEIGANSCIDRGALNDTVVGAGSKIDDLVMIGHNVRIGRNCIIVAQCGIAGSATLGDFVVMGAKAGIAGHVKIGSGVQIAGASHVKDDIAEGMKIGGTPAKPFREWARELAAIRRLASTGGGGRKADS